MSEDLKKVLSYGDVVLYSSDVALLHSPHWLNDNLIEFYFEYLAAELLSSSQGVLLVGPAVTMWISLSTSREEVKLATASLNLQNRQVVILAVNDSTTPDIPNAGSHWSLLVYLRQKNVFWHYDTCAHSNTDAARRLAHSVSLLLGNKGIAHTPKVVPMATPQQLNAYDCGVYVLAMARVFCEYEGEIEHIGALIMKEVNSVSVTRLRAQLRALITSLGNVAGGMHHTIRGDSKQDLQSSSQHPPHITTD